MNAEEHGRNDPPVPWREVLSNGSFRFCLACLGGVAILVAFAGMNQW